MPTASPLKSTVAALLSPGKGILAADESFPTIGKRFAALAIASNPETRRDYREMLFTTPGLGDFISGAILFDETLRQKSGDVRFPELLARQGIVPGIKVDGGTVDLPGFEGEKFTQGLDGLRERLAASRELGARFTKWRAVFAIGPRRPTATCIEANAHQLALFAALCQEAGLVPVVEPEVLMDGDHSLARGEEVTSAVLNGVVIALAHYRVDPETMLLKTGMILPGKDCPIQADASEIAAATVRCLRGVLPPAVPGIVFLSGGQTDVAATERLQAIVRWAGGIPWTLSFSFGRALQDAALQAWHGAAANRPAAQAALRHRAWCNSLAVQAKYSAQAERDTAAWQAT